MSKVLLGLYGEPIADETSLSFVTSKIGGKPIGLINADGQPMTIAKCKLCGTAMCLLAQIYCPLQNVPFHRMLYIFVCFARSCLHKSESWRVLRVQIPDPTYKTSATTQPEHTPSSDGPTTDDWCDDMDDWGNDDPEMDRFTPDAKMTAAPAIFTAELDALASMKCARLCNPIKGESGDCTEDGSAVVLAPHYINVVQDVDGKSQDNMVHEEHLLREYGEREGLDMETLQQCATIANGGQSEAYEKASTQHCVFEKFARKVAQCQEQILRYEHSGQPLYISPLHFASPDQHSHCTHCGGRLVFEMQVMPALISLMEIPQRCTMEFGTVLIYTCQASCWSLEHLSVRKEVVLLQADPDHQVVMSAFSDFT